MWIQGVRDTCGSGALYDRKGRASALFIPTSLATFPPQVLEKESARLPGLQEVAKVIQEARRQETGEQEVEDLPPVIMEEVHTCLLCNGEVSLAFLITFILSSLP